MLIPFKKYPENKDHRGHSIRWWHRYDRHWLGSTREWYDYGWHGGYILLILVSFVALCVSLGILIGVPASKGYAHRQCDRYEQSSGFTTKFEDYSYWSWQCYVRYEDRWVTIGDFNHLFVVQGIGD